MWVPPSASREMVAEREQFHAELAQMVDQVGRWNEALKAIDPHLELVQAKEGATTAGLTPGYWHVLRVVPGAPVSIFPVEGPDGEFREPDSRLFDDLERSDLWNDRALKARQKRELAAQRSAERAREREEEERLDEITERWAQANRVQVVVP